MTDYPSWVCPVYACSFSSSYSRNIELHLSKVHDWTDSEIAESLNNFWDAKEKGRSVVCRKSSLDPCYPVSLMISRNSQNSVSLRKGGGGID